METAVLGSGCFWCTEAVFSVLKGVETVEPGYCGGKTQFPSYQEVCQGTTGHIEVVRIVYDERQINYSTLLDVFFATHDPTTPGRQGNDIGPQYQSVIFAQNIEQEKIALEKIEKLNNENAFEGKICTWVRPAEKFWPAEEYHKNYFSNNPGQGYCAFVIRPKVLKTKKQFAELLKGN